MGKALDEIGRAAAWRYAVGQLQLALLRPVLVPPQLRVALLRIFGAEVGADTIVHPASFTNLYRTGFRGLSIGRECFIADECFLTGSAAEVVPVVKVDSRPIGDGKPGPITRQLTDAFHRLIRSG